MLISAQGLCSEWKSIVKNYIETTIECKDVYKWDHWMRGYIKLFWMVKHWPNLIFHLTYTKPILEQSSPSSFEQLKEVPFLFKMDSRWQLFNYVHQFLKIEAALQIALNEMPFNIFIANATFYYWVVYWFWLEIS